MAIPNATNSSARRADRRRAARITTRLLLLVVLLGVLVACKPLAPHIGDMGGMGGMGPDQCLLRQIAFCDTFQTIVGGGREGDLDPAKWSFTRASRRTTRAPARSTTTGRSTPSSA